MQISDIFAVICSFAPGLGIQLYTTAPDLAPGRK